MSKYVPRLVTLWLFEFSNIAKEESLVHVEIGDETLTLSFQLSSCSKEEHFRVDCCSGTSSKLAMLMGSFGSNPVVISWF
jgi:hypothetical protein